MCKNIVNHHNIHFKYLTTLFVNYISIKLKKKVLKKKRNIHVRLTESVTLGSSPWHA